MTALVLTREDILRDIAGFEDRIRIAKEKRSALPASASTFEERKKIKNERQRLLNEIQHVNTLIGYPEEALAGL